MRFVRFIPVVGASLVLIVSAIPAEATAIPYAVARHRPITVRRIGPPDSGLGPSFLNELGHIVFTIGAENDRIAGRAAFWDRGRTVEIAPGPRRRTIPAGVNARKAVVGTELTP